MIGTDQSHFDLSAWLAVAQALTAFAALAIAPDTIKKLYERYWYSVKLYPVSQGIRDNNSSRTWIIYVENKKIITSNVKIYIHSLHDAYVQKLQLNGIGGGGCAIKTFIDQHGDACLDIFRMPKKSKLELQIRFDRADVPKSLSIGVRSIMIYYDEDRDRKHGRKISKTISIDTVIAHYRLVTLILLFTSATALISLSIFLKFLGA